MSESYQNTQSDQQSAEAPYIAWNSSTHFKPKCRGVMILHSIITAQMFFWSFAFNTVHSCSNANPVTFLVTLGNQPGKISCKSNEVESWIRAWQQNPASLWFNVQRVLIVMRLNISYWTINMKSTCWRRNNTRGLEGLHSRSTWTSLGIPRSMRSIWIRCPRWHKRALKATGIHRNPTSSVGAWG